MTRHDAVPTSDDPVASVPTLLEGRHRLAMVYGGGGAFGIAYGAGVARGLADAGLPVAGAPALGTSAGSWVAAAVALGLDYTDFGQLGSPSIPTRRPILYEMACQVFGAEVTHPLVTASAVRLGSRRRHLLDGGMHPLADLAAASSAVPGLFPPHRIDGGWYLDGGMWSVTSVDAASLADHVIVVAPLSGRVIGPMGRAAGLLLGRELRAARRRNPDATITSIHPDAAIAHIAGRNPLGLFDVDRARTVYPLALDQGRRWGERLLSEGAPAA